MASGVSKKWAVLSFGLVLFGGLLFLARMFLFIYRPADPVAPLERVLIREGATLSEVATELEHRKILRNRRLFLIWARAKGEGRRIKTGEYLLSASMPPSRILVKLTRGEVMTHAVTIPEGWTRYQIARLLAVKGLVDERHFLSLCNDPGLVKAYGLEGETLEGFLYPDTYHFSLGLPARKIIDVMVKRFLEVIQPLGEAIKRSSLTLREVVTLASIVEKETGRPEERPLIASVFLNRLKRGMRLESDPTVIYGLSHFDGNLTRKDLHRPTPYNTYVIRGLPPGPIANPGLASIRAVLFPERTEYLYFVSKNDGTHHFSKTLREHNRAVSRYQKKRGKGHKKGS
ncbi:MAG: endolytic transglycosylase MltG [Deltaproteobacteria bacterium]|nr:endolytic transglycosylase MltG [Deltaproteobacteria bacterium]